MFSETAGGSATATTVADSAISIRKGGQKSAVESRKVGDPYRSKSGELQTLKLLQT